MEEWPFPVHFIPNAGTVAPPAYWLPTNGAASHASVSRGFDDNPGGKDNMITTFPIFVHIFGKFRFLTCS